MKTKMLQERTTTTPVQATHPGGLGISGTALRGAAVFALFLSLAAFPRAAHANASVFINSSVTACPYGYCKDASMFDLLVGSGDSLKLSGDTIHDGIGLRSGATITTTGTNTIQGPVDFSDTFANSTVPCTGAACTHPTGSSFSATTTVSNGTVYNPSLVSSAYNEFVGIDSYWRNQTTYTPTALPTQATNGSWNIEKTGTGTHVYDATSFTAGGNVTIGCGASGGNNTNLACNANDLIIIIITGAVNITNYNFVFASNSGLTDDQILFIIESSSTTALRLNSGGSAGNNKTIRGDFFLDNGGGYTIGQAGNTTTIDGRVFDTSGTATLTWNANASEAAEPEVPEPATLGMSIGGMAALIYLRRRLSARKNSILQ